MLNIQIMASTLPYSSIFGCLHSIRPKKISIFSRNETKLVKRKGRRWMRLWVLVFCSLLPLSGIVFIVFAQEITNKTTRHRRSVVLFSFVFSFSLGLYCHLILARGPRTRCAETITSSTWLSFLFPVSATYLCKLETNGIMLRAFCLVDVVLFLLYLISLFSLIAVN